MTLIEAITAKALAEPAFAALVAAQEHGQIAAAMSVGRVRVEKVAIADVQAYLQTQGVWWAIKAVAKNEAHPAYAAADAVMDVANARYENIDMSLPIVGQMFGGLVAASVITQAQADYLTHMGDRPDPVSNADVIDAMKGA